MKKEQIEARLLVLYDEADAIVEKHKPTCPLPGKESYYDDLDEWEAERKVELQPVYKEIIKLQHELDFAE